MVYTQGSALPPRFLTIKNTVMEEITVKIIDEYSANIKYNLNGTVEVKSVKITPKLDAGDIGYGQDLKIPVGETVASEATILKYFEDCKIKGIKLFDRFTAAILNQRLHES